MKKIFFALYCTFCLCLHCLAIETPLTFENMFKQEDVFNVYSFNYISKKEYKTLNKQDKKLYKQMKRAYGYWQSALNAKYQKDVIKYCNKALEHYELKPVIVNLMFLYSENKDYSNAWKYSKKLAFSSDKNENMYNYYHGMHSLHIGLNTTALDAINEYLKEVDIDKENKARAYLIKMIANYNLKNYDKAINNAKQVIYWDKKSEDLTWETLFDSYLAKDNLLEANKYAHKLYSKSIPDKYTAAYRMAFTSISDNAKLKYYAIAKQNTTDEKKIAEINLEIDKIDEKRLEIACKKTKGYISRPKWMDYALNDYMTVRQGNERFENYHNRVNVCLTHSGEDFKKCLSELKNDEEKTSQRLLNEYQERQRQIAEQERIRQMQIMNANLMQANYIQQQQNYILNRPRTTTYTRYGNTVYGYSY